MSVQVISNVWAASKAEGSALLVMLALADHANDDGVSWPGVERLAERARMDVRRTQRVVAQLVESGELYVLHQHGRGHTNLYLVTLGHTEKTLIKILTQRFSKPVEEARHLAYVILAKRDGEKVVPEPPITGEKVVETTEKVVSGTEKVVVATIKGGPTTTRTVINRQLTVNEPDIPACAREAAPQTDVDPWDVALNQLRLQMPKDTYHAWLRDTGLFRAAEDRCEVECPTPKHVEFLSRRLNGRITETLSEVFGRPVTVAYVVRPAHLEPP